MIPSNSNSKKAKRGIDELFGSAVRVDILHLLFKCPDNVYGQRLLARLLHRSLSDVQRNMKILKRLGLITTEHYQTMGPETGGKWENESLCRLNNNHPWIPALRMLLEHSIGSLHVIREELQKMDGIEVAFVYGSFATSTQIPESDIDLMVIGRQTLKTIAKRISELEKRTGREINIITHTPQAWRKKFSERNHFIVSLMETPKIFMIGDMQELEKITMGDQNEI